MLLKRSTRYSAQVCCSISCHGLRATELCALKWSQIDLRNGRLHVNRAKGGIESVHPPHGPELRALYGSTGNRSERSTPQHLDRISWRASTKKTPLIDDAPRGSIRFLPSPEKGKHWRAPLGCIRDTPMIDPGRTSRSAEEGISTGALAFPRGSRGRWGNAAHDYTRSGIPYQPSKRGAEGRWLCAPTPPPPQPRDQQ